MTAPHPQALAADPEPTAFATANPGPAQTPTLVNRGARMLLRRVDPETILCVTFTKAAAAEMQRRLFEQLGRWALMEDGALREALGRLGGRRPGRLRGRGAVAGPDPVRPRPGNAGRAEDPDHPRLLREAAAPVPPGG